MNSPATPGPLHVEIGAYHAWLFDRDRVLTKTATVHAAT